MIGCNSQAFSLQLSLKETRTPVFSCQFCKFLKTTFLQNTPVHYYHGDIILKLVLYLHATTQVTNNFVELSLKVEIFQIL